MRRVLTHVDRWGPGVLSIITLCAVVVLAWNYDRQLDAIRLSKDLEIGRLDREIDQIRADNREREERLREEIQMQQAITIALRADMLRAGVTITDITDITNTTKPSKEE